MCGRMTLTTTDLADVVDALVAEIAPEDARRYRARFNVAPSDLHWIVDVRRGHRVLHPAIWGYLASGRPLINVRSEPLADGKGFREALESRRCVVVSDGFLEWTKPAREPFWYHRTSGGLVLLAGLYQHPADRTAGSGDGITVAAGAGAGDAAAGSGSRSGSGSGSRSGGAGADDHDRLFPRFTVLTTRPNALVARVHDRMPVVLAPHQLDEWFTAPPARAAALLAPAPDDALVATPVSRRVSSVKNDDADCLAPRSVDDGPRAGAPKDGADPAAPGHRERRQGRLFDV
jgi:putative SOS response-associated peptidase YedK